MELIRAGEAAVLSNSGVTSHQLLFPENSRSQRVTVTRVTVAAGAKNPPHRHVSSEQIWVALRGEGQLILENGRALPFHAGDVVRFEENDLVAQHGRAYLKYRERVPMLIPAGAKVQPEEKVAGMSA